MRGGRSISPDARLDLLIGGTPQMTLPRGRADPDDRRGHVVDHRNVMHSLRQKPISRELISGATQ
jgi:hypothetical protein